MISFAVIFAVCAFCTAIPNPAAKVPVLKDAPKVVLFTVTEEHRPLRLECKTTGDVHDAIEYRWQKDGRPLNLKGNDIAQTPDEGTITFLKPKEQDAGKYQCFATSTAGTASTRVINVRKAYINAPKTSLQKVNPTEGKPFKLDCAVPDAYPKPQISWVYQLISDPKVSNEVMDPRITIGPDAALYFTSAEKKDANKKFKYVCMANTPTAQQGVPLAEYVIENVEANENPDNEVIEMYTSKDLTLMAGERTFLYCIYGGTPLAHPDWFKDGVDANGNPGDRVTRYNRSKGRRLLITDVWLTDAGTYKCVADNEKSKPKEHTFKVSVVAAPYAESIPSDVTDSEPGKDVTIPCRVAGVPAPRLSWTYNAKPLVPSDRIVLNESTKGNLTIADLTVRGAQPTDNGYYGCKAENEYDDIYSETLLNIA